MELARLSYQPADSFAKRLLRRSRLPLYAALALGVLIPALALGSESEAPVDISVNAWLSGCVQAEAQTVCSIEIIFDTVPGATTYTASVSAPDGSVVSQNGAGAGSARVWVPYVGNGTYGVSVSAYGEADGEKKELLGHEKAARG